MINGKDTVGVIIDYPREPRSDLGVELKIWRENRSQLNTTEYMIKPTAEACAYLHAQGYAHRNLMPGNILTKSRNRALIIGYSLNSNASNVGKAEFRNMDQEFRPQMAFKWIISRMMFLGAILYSVLPLPLEIFKIQDALHDDSKSRWNLWRDKLRDKFFRWSEIFVNEHASTGSWGAYFSGRSS